MWLEKPFRFGLVWIMNFISGLINLWLDSWNWLLMWLICMLKRTVGFLMTFRLGSACFWRINSTSHTTISIHSQLGTFLLGIRRFIFVLDSLNYLLIDLLALFVWFITIRFCFSFRIFVWITTIWLIFDEFYQLDMIIEVTQLCIIKHLFFYIVSDLLDLCIMLSTLLQLLEKVG